MPLPTRAAEHLFYLTPTTTSGVTLTCFTDTAGAAVFITDERATELHLPRTPRLIGNKSYDTVPWPAFRPQSAIPPSAILPFMVVVPKGTKELADSDCFLGAQWFGDRIWTFDYKRNRLSVGDAVPEHLPKHEVPLAFRMEGGQRVSQIPMLEIVIDDERLPFALDTGAMITVTEEARKILKVRGSLEIAGSLVSARTFEGWHKRHPEWRIVPDGDSLTHMPLIEVPRVTIGGYEVGPVWFEAAPDRNFEVLSRAMPRSVVGALGGSALHFFRLTIDHGRGVAVFEKQ
jgi:hypothetical protein